MADLTSLAYYIETFGCQMNENDSERIAGILEAAGARRAASLEESGLVVINTCAVRGKSEEKLYSYLGRLRALKRKQGLIIAVAGCVAQIHRGALLTGRPFVDLVVGPDNYHRLPEVLDPGLTSAGGFTSGRATIPSPALTARSRGWNEEARRAVRRESRVSAYITIMEGCDNFCAYCVVPFARGREKFRPLRSILEEVEALARAGTPEIQFLGQNVNVYKDPETGTEFPGLLERAAAIPGPEWIRFLTSHPRTFGPEIVRTMARSSKVCRQLHLPLQAGSSTVLGRMKRGYTRDEYLEKILLLRAAMPDIHLSTDIIVGFPGETEDEFRETLSALAEIRFSNIFSFRYSPRPRTAAAKLRDDVPFDIKRRRLIEVQALQKTIQAELHRTLVGRILRVLGTGRSRKDEAVHSGRSEGYQVVNFHSPEDAVGRFVRVRITGCGPYSLRGDALDFEDGTRTPRPGPTRSVDSQA
jgi:tRNA-2-methylthio-N6-dimethylallyladenosine synthase